MIPLRKLNVIFFRALPLTYKRDLPYPSTAWREVWGGKT